MLSVSCPGEGRYVESKSAPDIWIEIRNERRRRQHEVNYELPSVHSLSGLRQPPTTPFLGLLSLRTRNTTSLPYPTSRTTILTFSGLTRTDTIRVLIQFGHIRYNQDSRYGAGIKPAIKAHTFCFCIKF